MDDTISRQAVLKLLSTIPPEEAMTKAMLIQSVKQMDAAQPSGPDNLVKDSQGLVKDLVNDTISRRAAIDAVSNMLRRKFGIGGDLAEITLAELPSAQPETCEYYALCRHGRDENKLRVRLGVCEYCNEDADGYVKPIEKNCHAFIRFGMNGWELSLKANGWHGSAKIRYCPMCGRDLLVK